MKRKRNPLESRLKFFFKRKMTPPLSPLKVRKINDQLMLLDRAFLDPLAFPDKYAFRYRTLTERPIILFCRLYLYFPLYRHVIWASSSAGNATFPGLADAFARAEPSGQPSAWAKVHYHLSVLSQAINSAADTLAEVI